MLVLTALVAFSQVIAGEGKGEEYVRMADKYVYVWGVPQDDAEAVRWYRRAAEQGQGHAQDELRRRGLRWTVGPPGKSVPDSEPSERLSRRPVAPAKTAPKIPDDLGDLD